MSLVNPPDEYTSLLTRLYERDFQYFIPMDGNRYEDGICLRYDYPLVKDQRYVLDDKSCSMLEMMVALCIRVEREILYNPTECNHVPELFWGMINEMGLIDQTNRRYNEEYVDSRISAVLLRQYAPNGQGGLFKIKNPRGDMRTTEIWYQCQWYIIEKERG